MATISRLLKIIGLICRISLFNRALLQKETYNFQEPNERSLRISMDSHLSICTFSIDSLPPTWCVCVFFCVCVFPIWWVCRLPVESLLQICMCVCVCVCVCVSVCLSVCVCVLYGVCVHCQQGLCCRCVCAVSFD